MDFSSNTGQTFKIALYTSSASLAQLLQPTLILTKCQVQITLRGGNTLSISANPAASGTTAFLDFADTTWSNATITARGALIYKSGGSNPAVGGA